MRAYLLHLQHRLLHANGWLAVHVDVAGVPHNEMGDWPWLRHRVAESMGESLTVSNWEETLQDAKSCRRLAFIVDLSHCANGDAQYYSRIMEAFSRFPPDLRIIIGGATPKTGIIRMHPCFALLRLEPFDEAVARRVFGDSWWAAHRKDVFVAAASAGVSALIMRVWLVPKIDELRIKVQRESDPTSQKTGHLHKTPGAGKGTGPGVRRRDVQTELAELVKTGPRCWERRVREWGSAPASRGIPRGNRTSHQKREAVRLGQVVPEAMAQGWSHAAPV